MICLHLMSMQRTQSALRVSKLLLLLYNHQFLNLTQAVCITEDIPVERKDEFFK